MYGPICIFFIYYPISILNCILYSHSPIILSTLCKYIKPAIRVDYCRKSGYVRQKEVFSSRSREVQRKERFLHFIPEKNVYFSLGHTLHHYGPLWIIFALRCVHAVYIIIIFPYCISSATIFPLFYYLLSQLFWFFKCYFLFYIYILWFYILLSLRCFGSTLLYMAVFFPLFFRSFDVEISF